MRHKARGPFLWAILMFLCLAASTLGAAELYWDYPRPIAEGDGRFPLLLQVDKDLLVLWQESEILPGATGQADAPGQAWLSMARSTATSWEVKRRFAGPFDFRGTESSLFSATAVGQNVVIAASNGDGRISILLSTDGARTFASLESLAPGSAAVTPRIFPSATGGYILFVSQSEKEIKDTLSLSYSTSANGRTWEAFAPLITQADDLSLNFLPTVAALPGGQGKRDIVVFQSRMKTTPRTFQLYSKTSDDGGRTWSAPRKLSSFADIDETRLKPEDYDNQRPSLGMAAGRLWLTWERTAQGQSARESPQIYLVPLDQTGQALSQQLERVSSGKGSCSAPSVLEIGGQPSVVWFDDRLGAGLARVYLAQRQGIDWKGTDLSGGRGPASFGDAAFSGGGLFSVWQSREGGRDRVVILGPDRSASPPSLSPGNFTVGKRTRSEVAAIGIDLPADSSGMAGYSWTWSQDPAAQPAREAKALTTDRSVRVQATADGPWYFAAASMDEAGNWSATARLRFDRDRTPPPPPILIPADADESGFLASNSFRLRWITPENRDGSPVDDVAGYTWELRYIGGLEPPAGAATAVKAQKPGRAAGPALPGLSAWESGLVARLGPPLPPPAILGRKPEVSFSNVDDGYYLFSAAAIDDTGNIGDAASILVRANKYIPFTSVTYAESRRDDFGHSTVRVLGKGFGIDGYVEKLVLDRDGREPYDLEGDRGSGGFRVVSDTELDGLSFEDLPAASYRVGIFHPKRGWYWTRPIVTIDASGTLKFGETPPPYRPSWTFTAARSFALSIYDLIVLVSVLFSGLGIVLLSRQAVSAARDVETIRLEVLALVSGGSMPSQAKAKEARRLRRRGAGLRAKVTLTIVALVVFVVLLVAIPLGGFMISSESTTLAKGLQQRADVLLESVAQGGRTFLPTQDVYQLADLPKQTQAMSDANYLTLTGYGSSKSTDADVVWASNDPDILKKIDTASFQPGISRLKDGLSPLLPEIMQGITERAKTEVGDIAATLAALTKESADLALKTDAASQRRFSEINTAGKSYENKITESLFALANVSRGASPAFDPAVAARREGTYIFYKPVLYRRGQDQLYYRGMVRLEVSTREIVSTVNKETKALLRRTAIFAAIALGLGAIGAFLLSSVIVSPIRKVVKAVEQIRDTEDKEDLHDLTIEVASRDEIRTLADTINEMTDGLVKAAKASKELVVGKGIQKMFIPLDSAPGSEAKLSTGKRDDRNFEVFGYYEGAKGVSGDYWDFEAINSRYYYFIKCDISGKGVSAALIMTQVATMVINHFSDWKLAMPKRIDLTDVTYKINDFLEERHFKGRFAAFTLGVWDSETGVAYLCEAGDRKLHVWDAKKGTIVEEMLPDSPAAGPLPRFLFEHKQPFVQVERRLGKDDILLLYTDGIEEAKRHFRSPSFQVITCADAPADQPHENHSGGQDNEEFGYDRITAVLEAVDRRSKYRLMKHHNAVKDEVLTFDFSSCTGSLEEKIVALISVEKIFRMYPDPAAGEKDLVVVDRKIDDFLLAHFDQVRLYRRAEGVRELKDIENPGYMLWPGIKEDPQYDDLTILGIRRK